ncbi:helix-turn-helix domain-containing protein [Streptomyces sp. O3]
MHEADLSLLTLREREVLAALGDFLTNMDIAAQWCIAERTVKKHIANVFIKLDISSRAEAAVIATYRKCELLVAECPCGH